MKLTEEQHTSAEALMDTATKQDIAGAAFAEGTDAEHAYGVLYQGEWETPWDGTCVAVRLHARALAASGLPVLLKSFSGKVVTREGAVEPAAIAGIPQSVKQEVGLLPETSIGMLTPLIKHAVVRSAEQLRALLVPRHVVHPDAERMLAMRDAILRATILYSVWERDRVHPDVVQLLRRVRNWVPCSRNRSVLIESGVPEAQVEVIPHPYDPEDVLCGLVRRKPRSGAPRFYSIGRWEPRKAYAELLHAFLHAFPPHTDARLTIKYTGGDWPDYPTPDEALRAAAAWGGWPLDAARRAVTLIGERLPRKDLLRLHFEHDVYVCGSRGEAWCLPAFDAKVAGNRMIHVPWGGTEDFAAPDDIGLAYTLEPVPTSYGWEPKARWATATHGDLVEALRVARPPERFARPERFEERFGLRAVGLQMRESVLRVARALSPAAAAALEAYSVPE